MDTGRNDGGHHEETEVAATSQLATASQFEDADDGWLSNDHSLQDNGCWLRPPEDRQGQGGDGENGDTTTDSKSCGHERDSDRHWTLGQGDSASQFDQGADGDWYEDAQAGGWYKDSQTGGWYEDSQAEGWYDDAQTGDNEDLKGHVYDDVDIPKDVDMTLDRQWMDPSQGQNLDHKEELVSNTVTEAPESVQIPVSEENQFSSVHNPCEEQQSAGVKDNCVEADNSCEGEHPADDESVEVDDSMALVPYVPPDSPASSLSTSPSSSPRPHPNVRQDATGIPLHQNPLGMGQARFVRIHPMHIAAAVAAQRSQAAAMVQQQTRIATAAALHQQAAANAVHQRVAAAAVAQQQATAAAVAAAVQQQRTRATLMHQQLVRSRYMGAPVLVRQPFVPLPRVAAPMRVRMRLRRSVTMTEEISLHRP